MLFSAERKHVCVCVLGPGGQGAGEGDNRGGMGRKEGRD